MSNLYKKIYDNYLKYRKKATQIKYNCNIGGIIRILTYIEKRNERQKKSVRHDISKIHQLGFDYSNFFDNGRIIKNIGIYGHGDIPRMLHYELKSQGINTVCFISDDFYGNDKYCGIDLVKTSALKNRNDIDAIIIALSNGEKLYHISRELGKYCDTIIFGIDQLNQICFNMAYAKRIMDTWGGAMTVFAFIFTR